MFGKKQTINDTVPKPVYNADKSSENTEGCLPYTAWRLFYLLVGIVIFYAFTGFTKWFNSNNNIQREAEIHLNALIESGDELPIGEYADLEVNLVFGPYATYTQSREMSEYEITVVVKETEYYFIILEDKTVMSVATANDDEKAALSRLSNQLENAIMTDSTPGRETYLVRGELTEMENGELRDVFEENADYFFGLTPDSPALRAVVLDTDAGREGGYNIATAVIVVVVFIIVLLRYKSKKKKTEKPDPYHDEPNTEPEPKPEPEYDPDTLLKEIKSAYPSHPENIGEAQINLLKQAAKHNDAEAMYVLGLIYSDGWTVLQNYRIACEWFEKAAALDHAMAMYKIGALYCTGYGVAQDYQQALEWFEKAAETGAEKAMYVLGILYEEGIVIKQDSDKAKEWYAKAIALGHPKTMYTLGILHYWGYGVSKDCARAIDWLKKAADCGYAGAAYALGVLFDDGNLWRLDCQEEETWLEHVNMLGHKEPTVIDNLDCNIKKDYQQALEWYQKAAELGAAEAMYRIGSLYHDGHLGEPDYSLALEWYEKAADRGIPEAMYKLGVLYDDWYLGKPDFEKAQAYFDRAAEMGCTKIR